MKMTIFLKPQEMMETNIQHNMLYSSDLQSFSNCLNIHKIEVIHTFLILSRSHKSVLFLLIIFYDP